MAILDELGRKLLMACGAFFFTSCPKRYTRIYFFLATEGAVAQLLKESVKIVILPPRGHLKSVLPKGFGSD